MWGALEPVDQRLFHCDYSDIVLLGKFTTRGPHRRAAGFAIHAANGAVFGLVFHEVRRRAPCPAVPVAVALALAEHATLYPLTRFVDRYIRRGGRTVLRR
jgi:hypothetical protein